MTLSNEHTCVVNRLRKAELENLRLQSALQEVFNLQCKHVIKTHASLVKHTNSHETTNKGVTLEETLRVLRIEFEQLTGRTTDLGKDERDTPDLTLVAQTVLACEL